MLDPEKVAAVKRLLAEELLPQYKIAETVGVSRGSVTAIATGRRPDYEAQRRQEVLRRQAEEVLGSGPVVRCPDCGGMVQMPCRACHLRATRAIRPTRPADGNCELELRGEKRERYEEVRRRREMIDAASS